MAFEAKYSYDDEQRFIIDHYNWAKPFSNYFPGIAGKWGIPMWLYYVSRGQAVCSMGIHNKDHAIMEFLSFNKACMAVESVGFRTFIRAGGEAVYEPFRKLDNAAIQQKMLVSSEELELEEINSQLGLRFQVRYFPLVNQPIAGLVRELTIHNLRDEPVDMDFIDGLPRILPYGTAFEHTKVISRHIEGMMVVDELADVPLFRLKQTPADIEQVGAIRGGNFYFSFTPGGELLRHNWLVDPYPVFGDMMNYDRPWGFADNGLEGVLQAQQIRENRTPCAMTGLKTHLKSGESIKLQSVIGFTPEEAHFSAWVSSVVQEQALEDIRTVNREVIARIKETALTVSSEPLFDQYCQTTFLENVMRGGMPISLTGKQGTTQIYAYQRQNGDLERDYHWFILDPTYLSQGNSHYRNILQNRRMDTWFFPQVKDQNLIALANLIQLDGYNPLEVNGVTYSVQDQEKILKLLRELVSDGDDLTRLEQHVQAPFTPGSFIMALESCASNRCTAYEEVLADLLLNCKQNEIGGRHEGFWIDHWLYLLDLIEVILTMYPDQVRGMLIEKRDYTFYDNPDVVQPRSLKAVQTSGGSRQYNAVRYDSEKAALIQARLKDAARVHTQHGCGRVYHTNLLVKMLTILTNRLASLDARGIGSEMEAGKPGWCDSLNGLPGLFASSVCEALEMLRASRLLLGALEKCILDDREEIPVYRELFDFIEKLDQAMNRMAAPWDSASRYAFWKESHDLLEDYREQTRFGVHGQESPLSIGRARAFLQRSIDLLETNFNTAPSEELFLPGGLPYTYFINRVAETLPEGQPAIFAHRPLAAFLEGPVHYVRVFPEQGPTLHRAVRNSALYDGKLKMYRSCVNLDAEPLEIGRIKAYADGWLENQSIYTHMEYKWLLELFRAGMYQECFDEFKNLLVPFMDPEVYGRSTLDNCSFIVSSAFPDENLHGQAFQPHLSGMTCEFLNIWTLMVAGKRPFTLDENGQLSFALDPALPGWLFTTDEKHIQYWDECLGKQEITIPKNAFAFRLFGSTLVSYHNARRLDTYGPRAVKPCFYQIYLRDGSCLERLAGSLGSQVASAFREHRVLRMEVLLE